jgi:hypothetical protein
MEIGQAHLTGTVEEWTNVCDGIMNLECLHQVASLLADDLIQVLRRNPQMKNHLLEDGNRLTLTLSLNLEEMKGKKSETIIREWPSTS